MSATGPKTKSEAGNVHEAVILVMQEVSNVQKDGEVRHGQSYRFASETAFIEALRPSMLKHGLYIRPRHVLEQVFETYETSKGTVMNSKILKLVYLLTHAPSQTEIEITVLGEGADIGDKASNKAMTAGLKYALRQTFLISTGDDPDNEPSNRQERKPKKGTWSKAQKEVVLENTYIDDEDIAAAFLDKSELAHNATVSAIKKFSKAYQGHFDETGNQKESLEYAKENWRE